jgi:hypothetical protein
LITSLTANFILDDKAALWHPTVVVISKGDMPSFIEGKPSRGAKALYQMGRVTGSWAAPGGPRWRGTAQVIRVSTFLPLLLARWRGHRLSVVGDEGNKSMETDDDEERGRLIEANKPKRKSLLVNPQTLKFILAMGPWVTKILHLIIELVKLFKT